MSAISTAKTTAAAMPPAVALRPPVITPQTLMSLYLTLFVLGAITTVTEWKNIRCAAWKKVLYAFTFPLFMLTYVPICIASLFTKVEWKPICHTRVMTLEQIEESGLRAS